MIWLGMVFAVAVLMLTSGGASHAKTTMQTFPVLTGGGHMMFMAPDSTVWFTAQSAGKLGLLDSDLIPLRPGAALRRTA